MAAISACGTECASLDAAGFVCQTSAHQPCFHRVLQSGHKAAFLTRALLFPLPTGEDYRLYWNMSERRSEKRVKVLEL